MFRNRHSYFYDIDIIMCTLLVQFSICFLHFIYACIQLYPFSSMNTASLPHIMASVLPLELTAYPSPFIPKGCTFHPFHVLGPCWQLANNFPL